MKLTDNESCAAPIHGVIRGAAVRLAEEKAVVLVPAEKTNDAPQANVIRSGDRIEAIEVACACGRIMRLRCVYD